MARKIKHKGYECNASTYRRYDLCIRRQAYGSYDEALKAAPAQFPYVCQFCRQVHLSTTELVMT